MINWYTQESFLQVYAGPLHDTPVASTSIPILSLSAGIQNHRGPCSPVNIPHIK